MTVLINLIDHNQYIHMGYSWQANYCGGLRVLNASLLTDVTNMKEVAYFDVSPNCNTSTWDSFLGAWSVYPYFPSGSVVVQTIDRGLFILMVDIFL